MKSKVNILVRRIFVIKDFQHLWMLGKAIEIVLAKTEIRPQLSVLGKIDNGNISLKKMKADYGEVFKSQLNRILKAKSDFGVFANTEFGILFIAGNLAPLFLNDIYGKPLGTMSAGPYGILRGLGITEEKVNHYLKLLKDGHYLLIVRDYPQHLKMIQEQLETLR